jgi:riboflavin-specific deaminase-like protein
MRVFSNTAVSIDGKIADRQRSAVSLGSASDRRRMRALRASADAVLIGGSTFRTWPIPLTERPFDRPQPLINAVLTARGVLSAEARRWPDPRVALLIIGPPELDAVAHRERFGAEVCCVEGAGPVAALDLLEARGCRSVLVEGGGGIIAPLLASGRLQTMHVTVCPLVVGGAQAPTLADGEGFLAGAFRQLSLQDCQREGDELFLTYSVRP